jgi:hypothetical protein
MNPQDSESQIKENDIIDDLSADDLGVFVLGDYCNEIEQIFRGAYYCVPISCLVVTICVICYFTIDK